MTEWSVSEHRPVVLVVRAKSIWRVRHDAAVTGWGGGKLKGRPGGGADIHDRVGHSCSNCAAKRERHRSYIDRCCKCSGPARSRSRGRAPSARVATPSSGGRAAPGWRFLRSLHTAQSPARDAHYDEGIGGELSDSAVEFIAAVSRDQHLLTIVDTCPDGFPLRLGS